MIGDERNLDTSHDEVAVLIHADGQGTRPLKDATWAAVTDAAPPGVALGWKNFYDEDPQLTNPTDTVDRVPRPLMVSYQ